MQIQFNNIQFTTPYSKRLRYEDNLNSLNKKSVPITRDAFLYELKILRHNYCRRRINIHQLQCKS